MTTTPPAGALDVARLRAIIARSTWTFAKTMPDSPHEYSFAGKGATKHDINTLTKAIADHGYSVRYGRNRVRYLAIDDYKYWGTGGRWINRAELRHDTEEQQAARIAWQAERADD
jgi:hypothetical protein